MSNEQKGPESKDSGTRAMGTWLAIGVAIGVALGAALDNIGTGIAIGIGLGAIIGMIQRKKEKNK